MKRSISQMMSNAGSSGEGQKQKTEEYFDLTISDFTKIIKSPAYVDKTMLIQDIFNGSSFILITAPRRFGKSINMSMLKTFVEIQVDENGVAIDPKASTNYNIFKDNNLLIFQQVGFFEKHFGQYPVIHVDFKGIGGNSFDNILDGFRSLLQKTFDSHSYLLKSDKLSTSRKKMLSHYDGDKYLTLSRIQIEDGLWLLSQCLHDHFNKEVFVLIDEYDAPINNALFERNIDIEEVNELLCFIFSNTLKGNKYVCRGLLTGISYFASVILPGANNIETFMFLNDHVFVKYYGLTEEELIILMNRFGINAEEICNVRLHYNGYYSLSKMNVLSIWSIVHYLKHRKLDNYWQKSGVITKLKDVLHIPLIRYTIEILLQKEYYECYIEDRIQLHHLVKLRNILLQPTDPQQLSLNDPSLYITFLLQQGYLSYVKNVRDDIYELKIPNREIEAEFKNELTEYFSPSLNQRLDRCANAINELSPKSERPKFEQFAKTFHEVIKSSEHEYNESSFHCLLFSVLSRSLYSIGTEYSFPNDRPDLILCHDNLGVIIELKFNGSSKEALKQIIDKKYFDAFKTKQCFEKVEEYIYIGLNVETTLDVTMSYLCNSTVLDQAEHI